MRVFRGVENRGPPWGPSSTFVDVQVNHRFVSQATFGIRPNLQVATPAHT
jgi:hypothetical protein